MIRALNLVALLCALVFFSSIFVAHVLKPDLDWVSQTLSMYALDDYGYVINTGFICIGLTQILLATALFIGKPFDVTKAAGLLLGAGLGVLLVAIFPTKAHPADLVSQLPHIIGAIMQFLLFPFAALAIARAMNAGRFKSYSLVTAYATMKLFIVVLVLFFIKFTIDIPFFGLVEKIDILAINLWLIGFAFYTLRHKTGTLYLAANT
jgi:hypothetical membrane protein